MTWAKRGKGLFEFRILGPLEVVRDGESLDFRGSRERALLALLVLDANRTVSSERLAEDLWSGAPPDGAARTLRVYVSRVRRGLGDAGVLVTRRAGYLLQVDPGAIDATRFEALVAKGREQAAGGDYRGAAGSLREALTLWRGPALADVADAPSAQAEAARLEEARLAALEERLEADLACGRHGELAAELDALTRAHPLRERLWAQRMLALYRTGRQAEALRVYQELRRTLGELGIEPDAALHRLETAILRHEPELDWQPTEGTIPHTPGASAGGVVTFLFTDAVGSTELLDQLGDAAAEKSRQAHFGLLREAVAAHGGAEVKSLGDGLMVVFASPLAAFHCAVAMQEAVAREGRRQARPLAVRIGLHTGEPMRDEGDFFGTPVVVAKRLCNRAEGGQILVSALVWDLVGRRGDHTFTFRHLGGLTLKGLADPVAACELLWAQTPDEVASPAAAEPGPLPLPLGREERLPLVGRAGELARIDAAWMAARSGQRQLVLMAGEPGIGKSRLTADFARQVHAEGGTVLFGRCDEGMGVPYQPFVEALGRYLREAPAPVLGRLAGELVRLVPEVADRIRGLPPPLRSDPETERYRLFDALVAWLSEASQAAPVLLVLDDLHWATKPTLLLLRHLLRSDEALSLLAVAAYRDSPLDMSADLADALVEVLRQPGVERVSLSGLDEAGVAALMEAQARHELDDDGRALAGVLHAETAGNPFFVREMLRHLAEKGAIVYSDGRWVAAQSVAQVDVPDSVRELVGRRLTRLADETTEALALAAVLGERFELAVLAEASGEPESSALRTLGPAVAARLVEETGVGRYHFAHALVRATLEDALGPTRRAQLHRAAGLAVEAVHASDPDDHLPELAHHFARADDCARAVDYAGRAGDRALSQLAHDEAVIYYRQALEFLHVAEGPPDEDRRLELLLALGEAQRRAGEPAHRATLLEAGRLARERGDAEALARAALSNTRAMFMGNFGSVDAERVEVLEAALAAAGEVDTPVRARLLATLALELTFAGQGDRHYALSDEAVVTAHRVGDPATLAGVLLARYYTIYTPATLPERLANTAEALEIAEHLEDPVTRCRAALLRIRCLAEIGDLDESTACLEVAERLATELSQPALLWPTAWNRVGRLVQPGHLAEAERAASTALEIGQAGGQPDAFLFFSVQMYCIRREQGRLGEIEEILREVVDRWPMFPLLRIFLAHAYCEQGRETHTRAIFDPLAAGGFTGLPFDLTWMTGMSALIDITIDLGETAPAGVLYELLSPYADQIVASAGVPCGAGSHYLGRLAVMLDRFDEAEAHFVAAAAIHDRMRAPTWLARTRLEWARMLLTRRQPGDAEQAHEFLGQALATARELGLCGVERRAVALVS